MVGANASALGTFPSNHRGFLLLHFFPVARPYAMISVPPVQSVAALRLLALGAAGSWSGTFEAPLEAEPFPYSLFLGSGRAV